MAENSRRKKSQTKEEKKCFSLRFLSSRTLQNFFTQPVFLFIPEKKFKIWIEKRLETRSLKYFQCCENEYQGEFTMFSLLQQLHDVLRCPSIMCPKGNFQAFYYTFDSSVWLVRLQYSSCSVGHSEIPFLFPQRARRTLPLSFPSVLFALKQNFSEPGTLGKCAPGFKSVSLFSPRGSKHRGFTVFQTELI